jgi:hypothetical protein
VFVLAGVVAIGVAWRWFVAPAPAAAGAAAPVSPAARVSAAPVAVPSGREAAALSPSVLQPPVDEAPALSAHARRMRDDWCGFGVAEAQREVDALSSSGLERLLSAVGLSDAPDGMRVQAQARLQLRAQWITALRRQGTPRAEAAAAYLAIGVAAGEDDAPQARARLQELARSSTDPMLTALALRRPCRAGGCVNIDPAQWSRLEPANLQAWWGLLQDPAVLRSQSAYLFDQMVSQVRYSKGYSLELASLLASVDSAETPGLVQQMASETLISTALEWSAPPFHFFRDYCKGSAANAQLAPRCEALAAAVWSGGGLIDRMLALALAREAVGPGAPQRAAWEARARDYEAASTMSLRSADRFAQAGSELPAGQADCRLGPELHRLARDIAQRPEWDRLQAEITASGASAEELAREWRETHGRSALDPEVRPARAASQAR